MDLIVNSLKQVSKSLGYRAYLVGGFVRNKIMNSFSFDLDIVVDGDSGSFANEMAKHLDSKVVNFDKVKDCHSIFWSGDKGRYVLDFTDLGESLLTNLKGRDFTINALAVDIEDLDENFDFDLEKLIDVLGGMSDLETKTLRATNDLIFLEDPIRLLRAVRFMAQLDLEMDPSLEALIIRDKGLIKQTSGERIAKEIFNILGTNRAYKYFSYLEDQLGLLSEIFPDVAEMKDVGKCKYHVVDSWEHSLYTLHVIEGIIYADGYFEDHVRSEYEAHAAKEISSGRNRLMIMKLAALFHDVGKPSAMHVDHTGRVRFAGHEKTGADIIERICDIMRMSRREKEILRKLVYYHMIPLVLFKNNDLSPRSMYDFFQKLGDETLDLLVVSLADIISTRKLLHPDEPMGMHKVHAEFLANNYLTRYKPIERIFKIVDGDEIMQSYGIFGSELGRLMEEIRYGIFIGRVSNKESLFRYIDSYIPNTK